MSLFDLDNVTKRFGRVVALDEVDLEIPEGQTTALIGPSGAGKSTLLRLLIGLEWPDEGEVRFDGEPLRGDALLGQRRRIGYVIQEGGLFPHMTAFGNVALLARILGWSAERIRKRVSELADLCRLPQTFLRNFPGELSGGQRQRVSLIRALMLDPRVLLLDEPLGALDPLIRYDLQEELKQLIAALGKTAVLVTHDVAEAAFLADELVLLRKGRIVQKGSAPTLLRRPEGPFVRRFLSTQRTVGESA